MVRAEANSCSEAPARRGEIEGSCSERIPDGATVRVRQELLTLLPLTGEAASCCSLDPFARWRLCHVQRLPKPREFVANSRVPNCGRARDAVKPMSTRRKLCLRPETLASSDDGSSFPANFVLAGRCQRTTRLCVLIHPILPGLFAIETCRRSD